MEPLTEEQVDAIIDAEMDKETEFFEQDFEGCYLMVMPSLHKEEFRDPHWLVFHAKGGFGCKPYLTGRAVIGEYVADGEVVRHDRFEFERFATPAEIAAAMEYREQHSGEVK